MTSFVNAGVNYQSRLLHRGYQLVSVDREHICSYLATDFDFDFVHIDRDLDLDLDLDFRLLIACTCTMTRLEPSLLALNLRSAGTLKGS